MQYSYPSTHNYTPFPHQVTTAEFLVVNKRNFDFSDIGTGKTLAHVWAADYLMRRGDVQTVLILTTLSTVYSVWRSEILTVRPDAPITMLVGPKKRRVIALEVNEVGFFVTNHDAVKTLKAELIARKWDLIIVDEGTAFKNGGAARTKNLIALSSAVDRVWWLTGTPTPNSAMEIWAQAKAVRPDLTPRYFSRFRNSVAQRQGLYKWAMRPGWEAEVAKFVTPVIQFDRDQCIKLPSRAYREITFPMASDVKGVYNSMLKEMVSELAAGTITAVNGAVRAQKLLQIASGIVYGDGGEVVIIEAAFQPRIDVLKELASTGESLIVYFPFKHMLKEAHKRLQASGVDTSTVSGDTPLKERTALFDRFQAGYKQILLMHPKVVAHGITLTASRSITWFAPITSNEVFTQANGRITRAGQKRRQLVFLMAASPVERKLYAALQAKQNVQQGFLDYLRSEVRGWR